MQGTQERTRLRLKTKKQEKTMDNNNIVEQPLSEFDEIVTDSHDQAILSDSQTSGSTFGKFKDATSLLSAYNNLEAEFTRKSQKLSEALKKLESTAEPCKSIADVSAQEAEGSSEESKSNVLTENDDSNAQGTSEESEWTRKVEDFFLKNSEAVHVSKQMASIIRENRELKRMKNGLELAYALAEAKSSKKPADLIKDQKFIDDYIMKNDDIKSLVIREYLDGAMAKSHVPKTLGESQGYLYASSTKSKPTSIDGAGKIFEKMLSGS